MDLAQTLEAHLSLCERLYQLCLEEQRWLQTEQCPPAAELQERKRALNQAFDESLARLRALPTGSPERGGERLARARAKSLQILHLDRQNEQLLLRCSLAPVRPANTRSPAPAPAAAARLYGRSA